MIFDLLDALAYLLASDDDEVRVVALDVEPLTWEPGTLYLFPVEVAEVAVETGPTSRQDFTVRVVYVEEAHENAQGVRDTRLARQLDARAGAWAARARQAASSEAWVLLRPRSATAPRTLEARGVALDFTGYRLVT